MTWIKRSNQIKVTGAVVEENKVATFMTSSGDKGLRDGHHVKVVRLIQRLAACDRSIIVL